MPQNMRYARGYYDGYIAARPVLELEDRVNVLEGQVSLLTTVGAIAVTVWVVNRVKNFIMRQIESAKKQKWQSEEQESQGETGGKRRHPRDFAIDVDVQ